MDDTSMTYLAVFICMLAVPCGLGGLFVKNSKLMTRNAIGSGIAIVGSILIIATTCGLMPDECLIIWLVPTIIGFIISCIGLGVALKEDKENRVKALEAVQEKIKVEFYQECISNGVRNCKSEKDIQRVTLIADKYELSTSDIETLYYNAQALYNRAVENKRTDQLNTAKEKEKNQYAKLNMYSSKSGRDKRIAMLSDEKAEVLKDVKAIKGTVSALISASQQKEQNWGMRAGIANGMAGPVAGLAVAAEIEAKNAQIRTQNAKNLDGIAPIVFESFSQRDDLEKKADDLDAEIEKAKTKLLANYDAMTCLSKLTFSKTMVSISDTGTCTVTTFAKLAKPLTIFDDVNAVIDGTVIAKIYDGKTLVGNALLVLPLYGVKDETELKGMSLFCCTKGKKYTIEFSASNLWAMEL